MDRARSRAAMQDVELVDVTEDEHVPRRPRRFGSRNSGEPPDAPATDPPPGRLRRRRAIVVLVTVALLVSGVVTIGRATSREASEQTAPAGLLLPLDGPPWERWRAPAARSDEVLAATGVVAVAAVRHGRFRVTAYDEESGARAWERDLGPVSVTRPLTGCPHEGEDVGDLIVCLIEPPVVPGDAWTGSALSRPEPPERWVRVVVVRAATGEVVDSWDLVGRVSRIERIADDLVVLGIGPDGHARVGRYTGLGGELRWWYRGKDELRPRDGIMAGAELRVNDEFVLVQGWSATVLDATDGSVLSAAPSTRFVVGALDDAVFGTWTSGEGGTVRDTEGRALFTAGALFPVVKASDGQPADVLVLDEGGTLIGRSVPSGAELWRLDTYRSVRMRVGGHLVLLGVDGYQVVSARTGRVEWETPYRVLMWWAPIADGSLILGPGRSGTGAPTIEARRLDGGELAWVLPLDDGVRTVQAVGGHLVLRTREEFVLLE